MSYHEIGRFTARELATMLGALRQWQREPGAPEQDIATDGGTVEALTPDEIDALCERLNTPAEPIAPTPEPPRQPTCDQRIEEHMRSRMADVARFTAEPEDLSLDDLRELGLDEMADEIAREEAEGIAEDECESDDEPAKDDVIVAALARVPGDVPISDLEHASLSSHQEDEIREAQQTRADETPLSVEVERLIKITLSWGGPADYIEIPCDADGPNGRALYRFQDWFDGATRTLTQDDTDAVFRLWGECALESERAR